MASRYWIKLYIELLDDPKMGTLPHWIWRRFVEFCLIAGENGRGGLIQPVPQLAWRLRISEKECEEATRALSAIGVLAEQPDGWLVVNFAKRQAKVEPAERQKHYREQQHKQQYYEDRNEPVTYRNAESEKKESEVDVEKTNNDDFKPGPIALLSEAFVNTTHIPELTGGAPRWIEALKKMVDAGVTPEDLKTAIGELRDKKYQIVGPWSCVNGSIIVMSARASKNNGRPALDGYTPAGVND